MLNYLDASYDTSVAYLFVDSIIQLLLSSILTPMVLAFNRHN